MSKMEIKPGCLAEVVGTPGVTHQGNPNNIGRIVLVERSAYRVEHFRAVDGKLLCREDSAKAWVCSVTGSPLVAFATRGGVATGAYHYTMQRTFLHTSLRPISDPDVDVDVNTEITDTEKTT